MQLGEVCFPHASHSVCQYIADVEGLALALKFWDTQRRYETSTMTDERVQKRTQVCHPYVLYKEQSSVLGDYFCSDACATRSSSLWR